MMGHGDRLLLDGLVKDRDRLLATYDDAQGITAWSNRNILHVLNGNCPAFVDPDRFEHVALWNERGEADRDAAAGPEATEVSLGDAGITVRFTKGEDLLTEISAKFTPDQVERELGQAGFVVEGMWGAEEGEFLLTLARPFC